MHDACDAPVCIAAVDEGARVLLGQRFIVVEAGAAAGGEQGGKGAAGARGRQVGIGRSGGGTFGLS